jgi:adenosylcobinamide-GDP ribazoletransferase
VAGLVVGLGWAGAAWVLHKAAVPPGVEGALLLAIPLLLTGFLHLDGLLDCADALLGSRPAARRLEILKDVHLGSFAFGVGALWMLGTWQTLCSRVDLRLLVLLPVLARALVAFWSAVFPYARGSGLPSRFGDSIPPVGWVFLAACCAPCLVLWPGESVVALLVQFVFAFFAARRLGGGLTGDVYGAMICLSESAALLVHIPWKGK